MTTDEFAPAAVEWLATTRHPETNRLFTEMVFQPMLELLSYLRANGFKTFIVSGGGVEFMRTFAEITYGVPPEQVIGSTGKLVWPGIGGNLEWSARSVPKRLSSRTQCTASIRRSWPRRLYPGRFHLNRVLWRESWRNRADGQRGRLSGFRLYLPARTLTEPPRRATMHENQAKLPDG